MINTLASPGARGRLARPQVVVLATLCLAAVVSAFEQRPLAAQAERPRAATAQPRARFTRVFGSDSMQIIWPVQSPDGRWIVFSSQQGSDTYNLWVVPAGGGAPMQLTTGSHADLYPTWFSSGGRIAFRSDRPSPPGEGRSFVMTIPFDARTGRSAGPVQQVSLEEAGWPAVSPDGRWIVFRPADRGSLMVVPSDGGTARTVVRIDGRTMMRPEWSPDGREIYFMAELSGSTGIHLMRVSADSGPAQPLWSPLSTSRRAVALNATARRVLTRFYPELPSGRSAEISTFEGRDVARVPLHRGMIATSFTGDGRSVLATVNDVVAPIRVVPVGGGPARALTEARAYDWPSTWSADAARLAVGTRTNGRWTLLDLPVDGGPGVEVTPPAEAVWSASLTRDRRHLFYVVTDSVTDRKSLRVRRLSDGQTREIAPDVFLNPPMTIVGPGGFPYSGVEALYFGRRGDRLELRACAPEGEPRLLRSFPASFVADRDGFGVHGERIAWAEDVGDSSALLVAEGRNGAPRRVAVVQGRLSAPVWSPDGRWVAANYSTSGASSRYAVLVVGVSSTGQPSAPPRLVEAGLLAGWELAWLPDSRAVTVVGTSGQMNENDVWLISLREGDPPVNLTRDDPSTLYEYSLSPDGRYIAYPAEIPRGSSIWRINW
jgi:Tol biopolymer transport system component